MAEFNVDDLPDLNEAKLINVDDLPDLKKKDVTTSGTQKLSPSSNTESASKSQKQNSVVDKIVNFQIPGVQKNTGSFSLNRNTPNKEVLGKGTTIVPKKEVDLRPKTGEYTNDKMGVDVNIETENPYDVSTSIKQQSDNTDTGLVNVSQQAESKKVALETQEKLRQQQLANPNSFENIGAQYKTKALKMSGNNDVEKMIKYGDINGNMTFLSEMLDDNDKLLFETKSAIEKIDKDNQIYTQQLKSGSITPEQFDAHKKENDKKAIELNTQYVQQMQKRNSSIDDEIKQSEQKLARGYDMKMLGAQPYSVQLTKQEIDSEKKKIKQLTDLKNDVLIDINKPVKSLEKHDGYVQAEKQGLIPTNATNSQKVKIYSYILVDKAKKLATELGYNPNDVKSLIGDELGSNTPKMWWEQLKSLVVGSSDKEREYIHTMAELQAIAPIAILNKNNLTLNEGYTSNLVSSFRKSVAPLFVRNQIATDEDRNTLTKEAFNKAGVNDGVSQAYTDRQATTEKESKTLGKTVARTTGDVVGIGVKIGLINPILDIPAAGIEMAVGKPVLSGLNKALSTSKEVQALEAEALLKAGETATKASEIASIDKAKKVLDIAKVVTEKLPNNFLTRTIYNTTKAGVVHEIQGRVNKELEGFANFEVGAVNHLIGMPLNTLGQVAIRLFGKDAPAFVSQVVHAVQAGTSMTATMAGMTVVNDAKESESFDAFKEKMNEQFGTADKKLRFIAENFLLGLTMHAANISTLSGLFNANYTKLYESLKPEEKAKVDEFVKSVNEDANDFESETKDAVEIVKDENHIPITKDAEVEDAIKPATDGSKLNDIGEGEYKEFIDNGKVAPERLNNIAEKVKNKEDLSEREKAIFADKTAEINDIIKNGSTNNQQIKDETKITPIKPVEQGQQNNDGTGLQQTPENNNAIQQGGEQKLPDQKEVPIEQKQEVSDEKLSRLPKKKKDANIETPKSVDEPIQQAIDNTKEQGVKDAVQPSVDAVGQGNAEVAVADVNKVKPIRQLGTGANVYFETPKYRVNDNKKGNVLLNIHNDTNEPFPIANIEFEDANEAVKVAEILNKDFPDGIPDYIDAEKYTEATRAQIKSEQNAENKIPDVAEKKAYVDEVIDKVKQEQVDKKAKEEKIVKAEEVKQPVYKKQEVQPIKEGAEGKLLIPKDGNTVKTGEANEKFKKANKVEGEDTTIEMPNGETRSAKFVVVELDDIMASHDENSFNNTDGYPSQDGQNVNPRNYKDDVTAKAKVINDAKNLKPSIVISDAVTPDTGAPIISSDGVVLSGNGRTMAIKRSVSDAPERYNEYKEQLIKKANKFGLDAEEVGKMKNPILVKVDNSVKEYSVKGLDEYNQKAQKGENPIDKAIKRSAIINADERLKGTIINIISGHETMSDLFANNKDRKAIIGLFIENGIITKQESNEYINEDGTLTDNGKDLINDVLLATMVSPETMKASESVKAFRNKIINALPVLTTNYNNTEYSLENEINGAIKLQAELVASGYKQEDFWKFVNQIKIGEPHDPNVVLINRLISSGERNFKDFVLSYNESTSLKDGGLFGDSEVMPKQEVLDKLKEIKLNEDEKKIIAGVEDIYGAFANERQIGNAEVPKGEKGQGVQNEEGGLKYDNQVRVDDLKAELGEAIDNIVKKIDNRKNLTQEEKTSLKNDVAKVATTLIKLGKATLDNVIDKVKEYLKDELKKRGLTADETTINELADNIEQKVLFNDAIQYYKDKGLSYEEVKSRLDKNDVDYEEADLKDAWDGGKDVPPVDENKKQQSNNPKEVKKTVLTKRIYENPNEVAEFKHEIQTNYDLKRKTIPHEEALFIANDIVKKYGIDNALDAVRKKDIQGGVAQEIFYAKYKDLDAKINSTKDEGERLQLIGEKAKIASEWSDFNTTAGQQSSQMADIYKRDDGVLFNVEIQKQKYREANDGVLPKEIEEKFDALNKTIEDANKRISEIEKEKQEIEDKYKESVDKKQVDEYIKEAYEKGKKDGSAGKAIKTSKVKLEKAKAEIAEGLQDFLQAVGGLNMAAGNVMPSITKALKKIGNGLIKAGEATAENVFDKIVEYIEKNTGKKPDIEDYRSEFDTKKDDGKIKVSSSRVKEIVEARRLDGKDTTVKDLVDELKKDFPDGTTDRVIRDAFTGYGKTSELPQGDDATVRKLRRMSRYESILEDLDNGIRPSKTGKERDTLESDERAKLKEIREGLKKLKPSDEDLSKKLKTSQDAIETRLKNRIEDLKRQIDAGKKDTRIIKPISTPDIEKLRDEVKKLEDDLDEVVSKNRHSDTLQELKDNAEISGNTTISKADVDNGLISDLVQAHIEKGTPISEVQQTIFDELKEIFPDTTEAQVRDAILKQGDFKPEPKEATALKIRLSELKTQLNLQKSIEETQAGIIKATKEKGAQSDEVIALKKKLADAKKEALSKYPEVSAKELEKKIERTQKSIDEYKRKTAEKEFVKTQATKREFHNNAYWVKKNKELYLLQLEKAKAKAEFEREQDKLKDKEKSNTEKVGEFLGKVKRFDIFTSFFGMGRLALAAAVRPLTLPLRESAKYLLSRNLPDLIRNKTGLSLPTATLMEKSAGNYRKDFAQSLRYMADYYASYFGKKIYKDAISEFNKRSNYSLEKDAKGKDRYSSFIGRILSAPEQAHGFMKAFAKLPQYNATFNVTLENMNRMIDKRTGEIYDITDPYVQSLAMKEAKREADADVFMEDSDLARANSALWSGLSKSDNYIVQLAGIYGKQLEPVIKVPVNFFSETLQGFPLVGFADAIQTIARSGDVKNKKSGGYRGMSNLTPEQAHLASRKLTNQIVGFMGIAIGMGLYKLYKDDAIKELEHIEHWAHNTSFPLIMMGLDLAKELEKEDSIGDIAKIPYKEAKKLTTALPQYRSMRDYVFTTEKSIGKRAKGLLIPTVLKELGIVKDDKNANSQTGNRRTERDNTARTTNRRTER